MTRSRWRRYHAPMATALLAALLLAAAPSEPPIRAEGAASPVPVVALAGAEDVVALCRRLVPTERLRPSGDAVDQGEVEADHEAARDQAVSGRYELVLPAEKLAFTPYDRSAQRLSVAEPATVRLSPAAVIYATDEGGLPVQVNATLARKILAARAARRLSLRLVFDLPDEAVCGADRRGLHFTLGLEPVEWSWTDGDEVLATGSVAADRPAAGLGAGARATVEVGTPIAGPAAARKVVLARQADLVACYAEALRGSPSLDGVVVVSLGPRVAVSADSTGSPDLARCVERALGALAGASPASVPIRFELALPRSDGGAGPAVP
jgi:hypothetical protein